MECHHLEPLIEAVADGSLPADADMAAHLASCSRCAERLALARSIESLLSMRETPAPPGAFTAAVMARLGQEGWHTERVFDIGFNLAMAAGALIILTGAAGVAWSLGLVSVTIDLDVLRQALGADMTGRVLSQVQTIGVGTVLLTSALALWWWAEAATD